MKIRINKKQLMQGVKFDYIMANKPDVGKKIKFYYSGNLFIIIDHYDNNTFYTFNDYEAFRKKVNAIVENW
jgi:hypothetical protein